MQKPKSKKLALKRAKHSLPTRVFNYGARPPTGEAREVIFDQLVRTMEYKRERALKVRDTRGSIDALRRESFPGYDAVLREKEACERRISEIYDVIRKERSRVRKRVSIPELEAELERLKVGRDKLWAAVKRERGEIIKAHKPASLELSERVRTRAAEQGGAENSLLKGKLRAEALEEMLAEDWPETWKREAQLEAEELKHEKTAGAESGLFHGVKDWARADVRQAKNDTFGNGRRVSWPRELGGRVGLALDDGEVGEDGYSITGRGFSLTHAADCSEEVLKRKMVARFEFPRGREHTHVVELRVLVHRPMPAGAKVARAWIQVSRSGQRFIYSVQLAVQSEELGRAKAKRHESVSVKFGWSAQPDGSLRVATISGSDGVRKEIILPPSAVSAFSYAERLQSTQKLHFNHAQRLVRKWLALTKEDVPELRAAASGNARSPKRLCDCARAMVHDVPQFEEQWSRWKAFCGANGLDYFPDGSLAPAAIREAFPGVQARVRLALYLEFWRRKNEHLRSWEANQRSRAQRRRLDLYRNEAAKLAGRYEACVSETVDGAVKRAARKTRTEESVDGNEARITRQRRTAAPSVLKSALKSAFQ